MDRGSACYCYAAQVPEAGMQGMGKDQPAANGGSVSLLLLLLALCPCPVKRDARGQIVRSWTQVHIFLRSVGYPNGKPGYVVDHIIPLCACGPDIWQNLQLQRADSAKMKDRLEREACHRLGRT
jgi:hypothetical protein